MLWYVDPGGGTLIWRNCCDKTANFRTWHFADSRGCSGQFHGYYPSSGMFMFFFLKLQLLGFAHSAPYCRFGWMHMGKYPPSKSKFDVCVLYVYRIETSLKAPNVSEISDSLWCKATLNWGVMHENGMYCIWRCSRLHVLDGCSN